MRAVWSFWSKPYKAYKGRIWREPRHHLLAWGLSLRLAKRQFAETLLVTDSAGKALLVDQLGLDFTEVSTELDRLRNADPGWWALGKLVAYSVQDRPFIHLDTDVFLWRPLPASLTAAPVFGQCPEDHNALETWCGPADVERAFTQHGMSLPTEWEWARSRSLSHFREVNCGIVGGTRTDFLRYYANLSIDLVMNRKYAAAWAEFPDKAGYNMVVEQFQLAACIDFHRLSPESPFRGIGIRYLFPSCGEAYNPQAAAKAGYTHLLGESKSIPDVTSRLDRRVAELDPAFHRHCQRVAQTAEAGA